MSLKNLDDFINVFSKGIADLKYYEALNKYENIEKHSILFNKLLQTLFRRNKPVLDQDLWKELYFHSVYFYKFQNTSNGVPLTLVTKHNQIVPFYMSNKIHLSTSTLVHFDTHSDQAPVPNSALLPGIYREYLNTGDSGLFNKIGDIVWDIGAANSGILYTTGIRDVTWCLPSWVPDKQISISFFLKSNPKTISLSTKNDIRKMKNLDELTQVRRVPKQLTEKLYTKIQTGSITKKNLHILVESIKKNGTKYFLDIDLDYLVCNGKPFTKSYWKETFDLSSFHRTDSAEPNQYTPRYNGDKTKRLDEYTKKFKYEIRQINTRIKKMFRILFYLKSKGFQLF